MKPIKKMLLHEAVVAEIIQYIHKEKLKSGDKLPTERILATSLNVSRPIVREALKTLATDQLVTIKRGSGIYVNILNDISPEDLDINKSKKDHLTHLKDLSLIRVMIETTAAVEASKVITSEQLLALYKREEKENKTLKDAYQEKGEYRVNLDFERAITAICKNPYLIDYHQKIDQLWRSHYEALNMFAFPAELRHEDHLTILRAIEAKDEARMTQAVRTHLAKVLKACNRLLEM